MRFVHVEVDPAGVAAAEADFAGIGDRVEHARPVFSELADVFAESEGQTFATASDGRWEPLSAPYARWKAKHYPGQPVNVLTGVLRDSLTKPGAKYGVREVADQSLTVGTSDPVAQLSRHFGRNPVPFSREDEADWVVAIRRWIVFGEL